MGSLVPPPPPQGRWTCIKCQHCGAEYTSHPGSCSGCGGRAFWTYIPAPPSQANSPSDATRPKPPIRPTPDCGTDRK